MGTESTESKKTSLKARKGRKGLGIAERGWGSPKGVGDRATLDHLASGLRLGVGLSRVGAAFRGYVVLGQLLGVKSCWGSFKGLRRVGAVFF